MEILTPLKVKLNSEFNSNQIIFIVSPHDIISSGENNVEEKVAEVVEEIEEKHDDVIITEKVDENILEVIEEKVEENEEAVITGLLIR